MSGNIAYKVPRVGCGAAILDSRGRLLLGRRRRSPEAGCWGLLGGKVDWMEPVEHAIEREVFEEAGVRIRIVRLLCIVDHFERTMEPEQHWVAPLYLAHIVDGEPEPCVQEPEAIDAIRWFPFDELPQPLTQAAATALAQLRAT